MSISHDPSTETRLEALLLQWEEACEQGHEPSPEELCATDTALLDELRRRIGALRVFPVAAAQPAADTSTEVEAATPEAARAFVDYRELRLHARGGLGQVFEAHDTALGRRVALKFIRPEYVAQSDSQRRFLSEAKITGRLEHPGIVPVYALGHDAAGQPCYAMRFVSGISLEQAIRGFHEADDRTLPAPQRQERLVELLAQLTGTSSTGGDPRERAWRELLQRFVMVCRTVGYAHSAGVVHRDLKPANIMLGRHGETLVVDWGLAKPVSRAEPEPAPVATAADVTASPAGTPAYMSPEQTEGGLTTLQPSADVYSLGATLYCLLTGTAPLRGSLDQVVPRLRRGEIKPPRQRKASVPRPLEAICLKALTLRPADRYATAEALAADVENWLADQPVAAYPESWPGRLARWTRKHRSLVGIGAVALVLVAIVASVAALMINAWRQQAERSDLESQQRLVRLYIDEGKQYWREGDPAASLVPLAEALQRDRGDEASKRIQRLRLTLIRRRLPRLIHCWFHQDRVRDARFSPDGGRVITAGDDGVAQVWDTRTGTPIGPPLRHRNAILTATFSPDGRRVVTASKNHTARLWDTMTGIALGAIMHHKNTVNSAVFSSDGRYVATASLDGTARVWDAATGQPVTPPLPHERHGVNRVAFSPDSRRLVSAGDDYTARVWDIAGQTRRPMILQTDGSVEDAVFSPDGRWILTTGNNTIVWDAHTGAKVSAPDRRIRFTPRVAFSPNGDRYLTADSDGTAHIWATATGKPLAQLPHGDWLRSVAFSTDGLSVLTASDDQTARVWDSTTGQPLTPPLRHADAVLGATFSPDGRFVLTASADHTARLWDLAVGDEWQPVTMPARTRLSRCSLDGGRMLAVQWGTDAKGLGEVDVWETKSGLAGRRTLRQRQAINDACFSPDGQRVATAGADGTVRLWAATTGAPIGLPPLECGLPVLHVAFSRDGKWITAAAGSADGKRGAARVWDASTGMPVSRLIEEPWKITAAVLSSDGTRLLTSTDQVGGKARLWEVGSGKSIDLQMDAPTEYRLQAEFDSKGARLVAVGGFSARVYDAHTGRPLTAPLPQRSLIARACFSPDGRLVATAGADRVACLWDAATGELAAPPLRHSGKVQDVIFSPDSRLLATVTADNPHPGTANAVVQFWDVATGEPVSIPLECAPAATEAAFTSDGRRFRLISAATVQEWDLTPDPAPANDLLHEAELLAGRQTSTSAGAIEVAPTRLAELWQELHAAHPDWFASTPGRVRAWHWRQANRCRAARQWAALLKEVDPLLETLPRSWVLWSFRGEALEALGRCAEAVPALDKALAWGGDGDQRTWFVRAQAHVQLKHWQQAADDYTQHLRLFPWSPAWTGRASCYANLGQWDRATADYTQLLQLGEQRLLSLDRKDELYTRFFLSLLRLAKNDQRGYRARVAEMLALYGSTSNAEEAQVASWTATLAPNAVREPGRLVNLARRATAASVDPVRGLRTLGAALYRAGQYTEATKALQRALALMDAEQRPGAQLTNLAHYHAAADRPYCLFYLALCEHQAGHASAARQAFKQAIEAVQHAPALNWSTSLTQRLLRQEAEKALGLPADR